MDESIRERLASENIQIKADYESELDELFTQADLNENFYRNKQYSSRERRDLKRAGLFPLVINIYRPFLLNKRAILTSTKPSWTVVPLRGANKLVAHALNQILIGKWNADYMDTQFNLVLKDVLNVGFGHLLIEPASFLENKIFDLSVKRIPWKYILPDPFANEFDCQDAENYIVTKRMSAPFAQITYGLTDEEIRYACEVPTNADITGANRVEVIDRYTKFPVTANLVSAKDGASIQDTLPRVFFTQDMSKILSQEQEKLDREVRKELERYDSLRDTVDITQHKELHIHKITSVGRLCIYSGIMNIRDYPIITFQCEPGNEFKEVMGEGSFIKGIQKATNKYYLLTLHNAQLTGNFRVMGPNNAVKNKNLFQRSAAIPGVYLGYDPDPNLPDGGRPVPLQTGTLPSAFYTLSSDLIQKAQFALSTYSPTLGDPAQSPETFSTLASLQQFGTQTIKELARRMDITLSKAGEVMIQFFQNYANMDEMAEFIDVRGVPQQVTDPETGKPIVLNEMVIKDAVIQEIKNNSRIGQFACKVLTAPNLGSERAATAANMRDMIMNKAIPATPKVQAKLLELMDVPDYQEIAAEMEQAGDVAKMQEQMQKLTKIVEQLTKENLKLKENAVLDETRITLLKEIYKLREAGSEKLMELEQRLKESTEPSEKPNGE